MDHYQGAYLANHSIAIALTTVSNYIDIVLYELALVKLFKNILYYP